MDLHQYFLALDLAGRGCHVFLSDHRFSYRMVHRHPHGAEQYDLVVVDEAHHVVRDGKTWRKIYNSYFFDAGMRIVLSDPSQDPSCDNTINRRLEDLCEEENQNDHTLQKTVYRMSLDDVVRSTERITLASHLCRFASC